MTELPEPDHRLPPEAKGYWRVNGLIASVVFFAVALWLGSVVPGIRLVLVLAAVVGAVLAVAVVPALRYRRWRYAIRDHEIDLSHGTLVARRTLVPMRRIQHVETESGPLQGSYGLASVSFHTAAGELEIPALKQSEAERVRRRIGELSPQPSAAMAPRSLHPAAALAGAADRLRDLALPILIGAVVGGGRGGAGGALVYGLAGIGIALVAGFLNWRSERYWVDEAGVHYRHGIIRVAETSIPRDRVQGIDTVRGPIQRLFGLVALDVQAAGGGRAGEIRLSALSREAAAELRAALGLAEDRPPDAVRRLGAGGVLVAALTSGRLGVLVPLLAAATQLLPDLAGTERGVSGLAPHDVGGGIALAGAVLVAAWALSVLGSVVAFAGFTVARDGDRLRVRRGLLQRREASVPVARIDAVRVVENPLRQPLGLAELRLESAGYAREERAARTLFPLLRRHAIAGLLSDLLPEYSAELDGLTPAPARARRRYILPPVAMALAAAGLAVALAGVDGLAALGLVPLAAAFGLACHSAAGVRLDRASAVLRARRLARTTLLADARRLVRIERRDNVLTRRAGLATLGVGVGSGIQMRVRNLDRGTADGLFAGLAGLATGLETPDVHP